MKSVRITVLTLVSLACLLTLGPRAHGQEKQEPISEAKRQLILQIIEVMNQQTSTVESMDAVTREMARMFDQSYEATIQESTELTPAEKDRKIKDHQTFSAKFSERFSKRMATEIDFQKFQENLMLGLYDKYFSEQELMDLLAFHSSPTGQKALQVMPQLLGDSMRRSGEILGPQVSQIAAEVSREILDEVIKPAPKKKRAH